MARKIIAKTHDIVIAEIAADGVSSQEVVSVTDEVFVTPWNAIEPPYPPEQLAALSDFSGVRASAIDAIARNTVGLGHTIELDKPDIDAAKQEQARKRADELEKILDALSSKDVRNESPTFTEHLMMVKTDEEECGQGGFEIARNRLTGRVSGVFHVPGKRLRRRKDRRGFLLLPSDGGNPIQFYNFGEKVAYDGDGQPLPKVARNGIRWETNEILRFRLYSSTSRDYGLPRDAALFWDYLADKLAAQNNVAFFQTGGTPPTVVFITGQESGDGKGGVRFRVPKGTAEKMAATLKGGDGARSRVAFIPLPPGTDVKDVKLGETSDRDMGFVEFRADNRRRTLGSFRMSPIFIADVEDSGRYTAETERSITLEQVFDPEQKRYEQRIRRTLLADLGYGEFRLRFTKLAVEGDIVKRESAERGAEVGTVTRREWRVAHNYPPLPEAEPGEDGVQPPGTVPPGWNDEIIETGAPAGAENRTNEADDQRGLKPETGGRSRRQEPPAIEKRAEQLQSSMQQRLAGAGGRASRRARAVAE